MTVLQPGTGPVRGTHHLASTPETVLWGRLPCAADAPVLRVASGTEVTIDTVSHEGLLDDQGGDPVAYFGGHGVAPEDVLRDAVAIAAGLRRDPADGPHVVTGPVHVVGAEPGDLLSMTLVEALPRVPYGVVSNRHGRGALPGELPAGPENVSVFVRAGRSRHRADDAPVGLLPLVEGGEPVVEVPVRPFLGIMGVAVAGDERPHSVPPGPHGGNVDVALLTAGSTLHVPVQVPGALAYVGDPHFAQGDGEVALTAWEASLRVTVRLDVVPRERALAAFGALAGPLGETVDLLVPTGTDPDLDEALRRCVRQAVALLGARYGMAPHLAYAYLSAATDFRVSQVVDLVTGVHATLRKADFAGVPRVGHGTPWRVLGDPLVAPTGPAAGHGVLDGLRVAVKDLFDVAGHAVGAGVPARLAGAPAAASTAPAVADLLAAGASVRGIAHTDELAYSVAGANPHHGTPPNPAAPWALPGGSSSGPASAVATGQADVGLATDTAGSVRVPASYQGLWGLRTTHGAVSRAGLVPLAPSFDTVGWLARDPETLERVAAVGLAAAGSGSGSGSGSLDRPVTLAWARALLGSVEPGTRAAFEGFLAAVAAAPGVTLRELGPDDLPRPADAFAAFRTVQAAEAWRSHGTWVDAHPGALGDAVAGRFADARRVTPDEEAAARAAAARVADVLRAVLDDAVLVLPTTPGPAPARAARAADAVRVPTLELTCLAALAGVPALSVPALGVPVAPEVVGDPHGPARAAPVGVSLVGRPGDDVALVRLGARLHDATGRHATRPRNLGATPRLYAP